MKRPLRFLSLFWLVVFAAGLSSCAFAQRSASSISEAIPQYPVVAGPFALSPYNPHHKDEDPSLIKSRDGRFFICWFSNRSGDDNLYIINSWDGTQWSSPVRITHAFARDFYPSLHQDSSGRFHLAWFRIKKSPPFLSSIWYTHSDDGIHWDPGHEVQVTHALGSDWAPSIWKDATGRLLIYFASKRKGDSSKEIYVSQSKDNGSTWLLPVRLESLNDAKEEDDFPCVVQQQDGRFLMAWSRYPKTLLPFNKYMDVLFSTSDDGIHWQPPLDVTHNDAQGITDVLPFLYARHGGGWSLGWVSTKTNPHGDTLSVPVSQIAEADSHLSLLIHGPGGYSPRAVAAKSPDTYLVVWVTGDKKAKKLQLQTVREPATPRHQ